MKTTWKTLGTDKPVHIAIATRHTLLVREGRFSIIDLQGITIARGKAPADDTAKEAAEGVLAQIAAPPPAKPAPEVQHRKLLTHEKKMERAAKAHAIAQRADDESGYIDPTKE